MRNKSYTGALYGSNGYLMLDTLRHVQELVQIDAVRAPPSRAPDPRELKLAEQLVSTLEDPFKATDYKDEHREQVMALLKAKAQGKVVRLPKARKRKDTGSLIEHLQASLKAGRKTAHGR
jgi:DNA end-binding protein Ku